jgi:hypothetical protein
MNATAATVEEKELSIDSIEGLREFLLYAKEAFQELEVRAKSCASTQLCRPFLDEGKKTFSELESLVKQYTRVLDLGGFLDDEHIEAMQEMYNNLLVLQEDLIAAMEFVPSVEPLREKHIYGEKDSILIRPKSAAMVVHSESESNEVKLPIRESNFNSEGIRSNLKAVKRRGETAVEEASILLEEYVAIIEVDDEDYSEGAFLYKKCAEELESLKTQLHTVEEAATKPVGTATVVFLEEVERKVNDFATLVQEAKVSLREYFADDEESFAKSENESIAVKSTPEYEKIFRPSLFAKNELRPFIEGALTVPGNAEFLSKYFSSPGAFEAYLKRDVDEREKPSKFEKVFGIKHQSAFHTLLRDLTLAEVEHLEHMPSKEVREILLELDIQYEIYVAWMNAYDVMKDYLRPLPSTTFGEFYVRAMVEELKMK